MLANELFLDTAILRNNVVARAKALGYTPKSVKSSKTVVNIQIIPDVTPLPASVTIEKNTPFNTIINSQSYIFNTTVATTVSNVNDIFSVSGIELAQGVNLSHQYTANTSNPEQKFLLPNANTDTSSLVVKIKSSAAETNTFVYTKASDISTINSTANVYFLQEHTDGQFQVTFGDDVLGRKVVSGNIVILDALISDGSSTNGARVFTSVGTVGGYTNNIITTTTTAYGGAARETIDSIKFNAPKQYETQNRAVTINDYKRIISSEYADAESIIAWGGEDNDPPVYGKVFIAVKPKSGTVLTDDAKAYVKAILASKKIVSVTPEIQAPSYTYIKITSTVKYDSRIALNTAATIADNVKTAIVNYGITDLAKFDLRFRYSKLIGLIDAQDVAILNSLTSIKLYNKLDATIGVSANYTVKFLNEIYHPNTTYIGAITSTTFVYNDIVNNANADCFIDDLNGVLRVVRLIAGVRTSIADSIGTIDYTTGELQLNSFNPISITGTTVDITMIPASSDVTPVRDQIFLIDSDDVTITVQSDTLDAVGVATIGSTTATSGPSAGGTAGSGGTSY